MKHNLFRWKLLFVLPVLLGNPVLAEPEYRPASQGPLVWNDPNAQKIDAVVAIYGNPRLGLITRVGERVQRVPNEDKWYLETTGNVGVMGINRATAQIETQQVAALESEWCASPDGKWFFGGRRMPAQGAMIPVLVLECFDLKSGKPLWAWNQRVAIIDASFSLDGKQLIIVHPASTKVGDLNRVVSWFDTATGEKVREVALLDTPGFSSSFSNDCIGVSQGAVIVTRGGESDAKCFVIKDGATEATEVDAQKVNTKEKSETLDVRVGGLHNELIAVYTDSIIRLYRQENGELKKIHEIDTTPQGDYHFPNNIRFSPDGTVMLASTRRRTFIISTSDAANPILKHLNWGGTLGEYNSDGKFFVFFDDGGGVIYNTATWERVDRAQLEEHPVHCCPIVDAEFSMNGNLIVSNDNHRLLLWSKDGRLLAELASPRDNDGQCTTMQSPIIADSVQKVYACDGWDFLEWDINEIAARVKRKPVNTPRVVGKVVFQERKSAITTPEVMNIALDASGKNLITATYNTVRYRPLNSPGTSVEVLVPRQDIVLRPRVFMKSDSYPNIVAKCGSDAFALDPSGKEKPVTLTTGYGGIDLKNLKFFNSIQRQNERFIATRAFDSGEKSSDVMKIPDSWGSQDGKQMLVSSDGRWLVVLRGLAGWETSLSVIDWSATKIVCDQALSWNATSMEFSNDGTKLIVGSSNRAIYVFDFKRMCEGGK